MKLLMFKTVHLLVLALLLGAVSGIAWAQVYKVVDKDGNVSYTDTAPKDGSGPIDLAPISVIETPEYQRPAKKDQADDDKSPSLTTLRSRYRDFAITSPKAEDSEWSPEQNLTIQWSTATPIAEGMLVKATVDGVALTATAANTIAVDSLDRGEHTVAATLVDAKGKLIARAAPVTFFVRQPNLYNRPATVSPTPHSQN